MEDWERVNLIDKWEIEEEQYEERLKAMKEYALEASNLPNKEK